MTVPDDARSVPGRRRFNPTIKLAAGTVVGVAAIWLVISTAGGVGDAVDAVSRMRAGFVALAVLAATVRLGLYGIQIRSLGRRTGPLTTPVATGLALIVFGFGAITPASPAEGLALASRELEYRGRSKRQAHLTLGFSEWFAQRTFYALAALDLILVIAIGHLTLAASWPLIIVAVVVLAALGSTALLARRATSAERVAIIARALRIGRPRPAEADTRTAADIWHSDAIAMIGPQRRRFRLAGASSAAVIADAATLWATCHAAGFHIHPEIALLATTVGTMASWVPLLPGGLGIVEAAIPAIVHHFGAPLGDALAATLVYRTVGTLLPAIAGAIAIPVLRSHRAIPDLVPARASTQPESQSSTTNKQLEKSCFPSTPSSTSLPKTPRPPSAPHSPNKVSVYSPKSMSPPSSEPSSASIGRSSRSSAPATPVSPNEP